MAPIFWWMSWSVGLILYLMSSTFAAPWNLPSSSGLLYDKCPQVGLCEVYLLNSQGDSQQGSCAGSIHYLDYSYAFNSIIAVCRETSGTLVRIFPIDKSHEVTLHGNGSRLGSLEEPAQSHFAFDWSTGLLYFSELTNISLIDLKQPNSQELLIYSSNLTQFRSYTIHGLIVRPENVSLIWSEHFKNDGNKIVYMQSSQDGKNVTELYSKENRRLDYISYDYSSNQFLAVYVTGEGNAKGYRFLYDKFENRNFNLNISNVQVGNKIILFNGSLIFTSHALDKPSNKSILKWRLPDGQLNGRIEPPIPLQWREFSSQVLALMDRKGRPQVNNRCEGKQIVCSHMQDYCIPHSRKAFICKSHPNRIHMEDNSKSSKWPIIFVAVLCLIVIVIALGGTLLTKKRVRFYQIRLTNISRVNSSKLAAKTEATEEVAE